MLNVLKKIYRRFFQQKQQVLNFDSLMQAVDEAESFEGLLEVVEYLQTNLTKYKRIQIDFAKERFHKRHKELIEEFADDIQSQKALI